MFEQILKLVTGEENFALMQSFSEANIFSAIWSLNLIKLLAPMASPYLSIDFFGTLSKLILKECFGLYIVPQY